MAIIDKFNTQFNTFICKITFADRLFKDDLDKIIYTIVLVSTIVGYISGFLAEKYF